MRNLFTSSERTHTRAHTHTHSACCLSKRNVGLTSVDNPSPARWTATPWAPHTPAARRNDWLRASLPSLSVRQARRSAKHTSREDIKKAKSVVHSVVAGAEMFSSLNPPSSSSSSPSSSSSLFPRGNGVNLFF